MPSMALPSSENIPPSCSPCVSAESSGCATADEACIAGAIPSAVCSSACTRFSSSSTRVESSSRASGTSFITVTRLPVLPAVMPSISRHRLSIALRRPRWQKLHQYPEKEQRKKRQGNCDKRSFSCHEVHLVGRVAEKALREELSADHYIPS